MKKEKFDITGMSCAACSARVTKAVEKVAGTQDVNVNLLTNSMQLSYDESATSAAAIIAAVEDAGYRDEASPHLVHCLSDSDDVHRDAWYVRAAVRSACA